MTESLQGLGLVPFFTQQLADVDLLQKRCGRVLAVYRARHTVGTNIGEMEVEFAPPLRDAAAVDRPTVGDWVILDESLSRIEQVLNRKSLFKRVSAGGIADIQPIAANIDTLFIVTSCNDEFNESRLERYLTLCAEAGATAVIVLTKTDLADNVTHYVDRARTLQPGVPVETANATNSATLAGIHAWIVTGSTAALVGSSGVGKSTLLNSLAGQSIAETSEIREQDKKGRHTTTHRQLHKLPAGGLLIDVPGMRELRVADIDESINNVFSDIEQLAAQCRFADCQHTAEPGCAVRHAVEKNRLEARRLASFKKLKRENEFATASLAEKRAQGRNLAKMVKEAKQIKQNKGTK